MNDAEFCYLCGEKVQYCTCVRCVRCESLQLETAMHDGICLGCINDSESKPRET